MGFQVAFAAWYEAVRIGDFRELPYSAVFRFCEPARAVMPVSWIEIAVESQRDLHVSHFCCPAYLGTRDVISAASSSSAIQGTVVSKQAATRHPEGFQSPAWPVLK